jgi:peptide chain release factor 3
MKLFHVRSGKTVFFHNPVLLFASDVVEDAWPGDIIGIPNHGTLCIGDTLTEGEELHYPCLPSFAPELMQRVHPVDPLRSEHLNRALDQLAEEGVARVFRTDSRTGRIVGVAGGLQFDVLADWIRIEYDIPVQFLSVPLSTARWVAAESAATLQRFIEKNADCVAIDHTGAPTFLVRNAYHLERTQSEWPEIRFLNRYQAPVNAQRVLPDDRSSEALT